MTSECAPRGAHSRNEISATLIFETHIVPEHCRNSGNEYTEITIKCPFCDTVTDEIEVDAYIDKNAFFWCKGCCDEDRWATEILLCPGESSIWKMEKGLPVKRRCCVLDKKTDSKREYKIGVLELLEITNESTTDNMAGKVDPNRPYVKLPPGIIKFKDIPAGIDWSHDGIYLYYKARCTVCHKEYESCIDGD